MLRSTFCIHAVGSVVALNGRALIFADSVQGIDVALPFVRHAIIGSLKEGGSWALELRSF